MRKNRTTSPQSKSGASLRTSHKQIVFALLVASCQQFLNKSLTACNNLVEIIELLSAYDNRLCEWLVVTLKDNKL